MRAMRGISLVIIGVAVVAGVAFIWPHRSPVHQPTAGPATNGESDDEHAVHDEIVTVKTIHPKRDRAFTVTLAQLATVEPYFQANLRARASGVIKYIPKDVGARVRQGELLVEIDVPDLVQEVAQKQAVVLQRRQEQRLAEAQLQSARAYLDVAKAAIDQAETLVTQAKATRELREKRWNRFKTMRTERTIPDNVVDEEERDYQS